MLLFASDLDNTLIYSYKKISGDAVLVETKEGKALSYMTASAYRMLQEIRDKVTFLPVTTRSVEQYKRISFYPQGEPHYALTSNGGILLVDGKADREWLKETRSLIEDSMGELQRAIGILKNDSSIYFEVRLVDDIFVFTKSSAVEKSVEKLKRSLSADKVYIDFNGEKLYVFPKVLDKGLAVRRFLKRERYDSVFACGDSLFDIPMLREADVAFIPKGSLLEKYLRGHGRLLISEKEGIWFADYFLEKIERELESRNGKGSI